jgi:hypothetical protein
MCFVISIFAVSVFRNVFGTACKYLLHCFHFFNQKEYILSFFSVCSYDNIDLTLKIYLEIRSFLNFLI